MPRRYSCGLDQVGAVLSHRVDFFYFNVMFVQQV